MKICLDKVYYIEAENYPSAVLCIRPVFIFDKKGDRLYWEETGGSGVSLHLEACSFDLHAHQTSSKGPDKIELKTTDGEKFILHNLTLELYNEKVRPRIAGKISFANDDQVQDFYLNTNFSVAG